MTKKIKENKIICLHCEDVIVSTHVHDFKYCKCGSVFVDGGNDYLRRGFPNSPSGDHYKELSTYHDNNSLEG